MLSTERWPASAGGPCQAVPAVCAGTDGWARMTPRQLWSPGAAVPPPQEPRQGQGRARSTFEGRWGEDALLPLLGRRALRLRGTKQREAVREGTGTALLGAAPGVHTPV